VKDSLENKFASDMKHLTNAHASEMVSSQHKEITQKYQSQMSQIDTIISNNQEETSLILQLLCWPNRETMPLAT
jgi:hypothetical protein